MKEKERLGTLEAENEELKNRVSILEGYVLGLQLALAKMRREKAQPFSQPFTVPYPTIYYSAVSRQV